MDPTLSSAAGVGLAASGRLLIDSPADIGYAARALAVGAVTATAFGNFYVIISRPAIETVRRINVIKGRPIDQVSSITHRGKSDFSHVRLVPAA